MTRSSSEIFDGKISQRKFLVNQQVYDSLEKDELGKNG